MGLLRRLYKKLRNKNQAGAGSNRNSSDRWSGTPRHMWIRTLEAPTAITKYVLVVVLCCAANISSR